MAANPRKILVTCALPYANGSIHLGHMLEHIQADVWVRYQRLRGNTTHFICADDAHGTPIMLKAQQMGVEPEAMIAGVQQEHRALISALIIITVPTVRKTANSRRSFTPNYVTKGILPAALSLSCLIQRKKCSCRIAL